MKLIPTYKIINKEQFNVIKDKVLNNDEIVCDSMRMLIIADKENRDHPVTQAIVLVIYLGCADLIVNQKGELVIPYPTTALGEAFANYLAVYLGLLNGKVKTSNDESRKKWINTLEKYLFTEQE